MPGQIVTVSNNEAISEVALKCGDPLFKDFPRNIYSQAVYRAERSIAQEYGIMDRVWTHVNENGTSPIVIAPLNFKGAWRITVVPADTDGEVQADGVEQEYGEMTIDDVLDNGQSPMSTANYYYNVIYNANQYELFYTWPATNDYITVYYVSGIAGEEDYEYYDDEGNANAIPVLPNKYFEETVRRSVRYMAQLGLAQFEGTKSQRYARVLGIYTTGRDGRMDHSLERSRPFIMVKPINYP